MTLVKATLIPRQGPAVLQQAEGRAGQGLRAGDPPACGEREDEASRASGAPG